VRQFDRGPQPGCAENRGIDAAAAKDRLAAALDYEVNVKSETAIAELHDKVDRLQDVLDRLLPAGGDDLLRRDALPIKLRVA
jgi:uncharacterized membrane protein